MVYHGISEIKFGKGLQDANQSLSPKSCMVVEGNTSKRSKGPIQRMLEKH